MFVLVLVLTLVTIVVFSSTKSASQWYQSKFMTNFPPSSWGVLPKRVVDYYPSIDSITDCLMPYYRN